MDENEWRKHMATQIAEGFVLDDPRYQRLSAWNYILHQLYLASALSKQLHDREPALGDINDANEAAALFHSAVMSYGRCFVATAPGLISLDENKVFENGSSLRLTHDELMEIRNTLVAHTGNSNLIRVTIASKEHRHRIVLRHLTTIELPSKQQLDEYVLSFEHAHDYVTIRINRYLERIERETGKQIILG